MEARNGTIRRSKGTRLKSGSIKTTLYDLIGAVQEVLPREEEKMVTLVVRHLLNRTPVRYQNASGGYSRIVV
jgi:ribosomal protein L17